MFAGYKNQIPRWRMAGLGMNPPSELYIDKVLGIQSASLIGYWPLNETSGTSADNAEGTAARDGTYTGVALNSILGPDGVNGAPLFDGANDFVDVYSASLNTAFSAPAAGTLTCWARVFNVGVWTDGTIRRPFHIEIDASNTMQLFRPANNGRFNWLYSGGGTADQVIRQPLSITDWFHLALTWDTGTDEFISYFQGVQNGAIQSGIGTLVGNLSLTGTLIGALDTGPNNVWNGYLAHAAIWTIALTPAEVLDLATV